MSLINSREKSPRQFKSGPCNQFQSGVNVTVASEFSKLFVSVRIRDAAPVLSLDSLVAEFLLGKEEAVVRFHVLAPSFDGIENRPAHSGLREQVLSPKAVNGWDQRRV
jgi:hypothetical protein